MKDIFSKLVFNIRKNYQNFIMIYPFLPESMKLEKVKKLKIEKFQKLITSLHDKIEYLIYIRNLKQALNDGLILRKVHRLIKVN